MRALLASMLLLISSACFAQGFGTAERSVPGAMTTPEFLPVTEAYQLAVEILDERRVRLYWQITPGYYLYQHRFEFTLEDAEGAIELRSEMPEGLRHNDEYFGEVEIYYNSADITLLLQRTPAAGATLSATSQAAPTPACATRRTGNSLLSISPAAKPHRSLRPR
ncbi:MAG: hypothetical protein IPG64_11745 [Haliea sp.]|nr:hypothetical protein [Haliea sp.]